MVTDINWKYDVEMLWALHLKWHAGDENNQDPEHQVIIIHLQQRFLADEEMLKS